MEDFNFTNGSYVLYSILPLDQKIEFMERLMNLEDADDLSQEYYTSHFSEVLEDDKINEIGILSYYTPDGDKVNIIFHDNVIHVNCDRLVPIKELIYEMFYEGNIMVRDKSFKKTPENRHRYHMRYYRAYRKANIEDDRLPISEN